MKSAIFHLVVVTHPAYLTEVKRNEELETVGLAADWMLWVIYFENCFDGDLSLIPLSLMKSIAKDLCSNIRIESLQTIICVQVQTRKELKGTHLNASIHLRVIKTSDPVSMVSTELNTECLSLP